MVVAVEVLVVVVSEVVILTVVATEVVILVAVVVSEVVEVPSKTGSAGSSRMMLVLFSSVVSTAALSVGEIVVGA